MRSTINKWPRCHPRTQFAHTSKCADGALAPTAPYLCTHHESKSHQRPLHPDKPTQHTPRHKTTPKMCVRAHLPHSLQEASTNRGKPRNMRCYVAQESSARCHAAQIRLLKRSGRMFNHTYTTKCHETKNATCKTTKPSTVLLRVADYTVMGGTSANNLFLHGRLRARA